MFAAIAAVTAALTWAPRILPGLTEYVPLLVGIAFLYAAIRLAQREPGGMRRHGIELGGLLTPTDASDARSPGPFGLWDLGRVIGSALPSALKESGIAIGLAALIFPPFVIGFALWHDPSRDFVFTWPEELGSFVATQLLVVALPEEAFFRGYAQTRLHDRWPARRRILGAELHLNAWLLTAALFAIVHFVSTPHPARLAVFFPGLVFGWLRAWRGGIGAAMLFHAMCNVFAQFLETGWGVRG